MKVLRQLIGVTVAMTNFRFLCSLVFRPWLVGVSWLVRDLVPNSSGLGPQELKSYSRFGGMRRHIAWNIRWPIYGHADDPLKTLKELDYFRTFVLIILG